MTTRCVKNGPAAIRQRWTVTRCHLIHSRSSTSASAAGLPVVLVHGLGVSSRYMIPALGQLGREYEVHAPDLPGFGRSEKPEEVLDIPALADCLADWLHARRLARVALLGNSLGCQIIVETAVRYPALVDRVVLQGPTIDRTARTVTAQLLRLVLDIPREPVAGTLVIAREYLDCGPRRLLRTLRHALRDRIEDKLPRMAIPALVVRGSRDPIVPQRWAEEVAERSPCARLVVIPGAAHIVNYAAPKALARVVRPFLSGTDQPDG